MTEPGSGAHAGGGTHASAGAPEPSYAERARTLLLLARIGSLSTLSRKQPGWPFGSLMPYALDGGRPLFLISSMAMHTQNLAADPRASLLATEPGAAADPLGAGRVTLLGKVLRIPEEERPAAREIYLARHENARHWADFDDFGFYGMEVVDVYFVGGFGVMGWIAAEEYQRAEPDPLAEAAPAIIGHMNADHADALPLLARAFGGFQAQEAMMTSVDRLGFHVRMIDGERVYGGRVGFLREVRTAQETRAVLVEMVRRARGSIS